MSQSIFQIRHGQFHDVEGPARRQGSLTFVPATVTLTGSSFSPEFELHTCMDDAPAGTRAIVRPGSDAPWVLGRLIRLFHTPRIPEEDRCEKTCFFASFLAVLPEQDHLAIPFQCMDYYCKSGLFFSSDDPPDQSLKVMIARSFWALLLSDPTDLEDYDDKMYHSGGGFWIRFGVEDGEPYVIEDVEE